MNKLCCDPGRATQHQNEPSQKTTQECPPLAISALPIRAQCGESNHSGSTEKPGQIVASQQPKPLPRVDPHQKQNCQRGGEGVCPNHADFPFYGTDKGVNAVFQSGGHHHVSQQSDQWKPDQ